MHLESPNPKQQSSETTEPLSQAHSSSHPRLQQWWLMPFSQILLLFALLLHRSKIRCHDTHRTGTITISFGRSTKASCSRQAPNLWSSRKRRRWTPSWPEGLRQATTYSRHFDPHVLMVFGRPNLGRPQAILVAAVR